VEEFEVAAGGRRLRDFFKSEAKFLLLWLVGLPLLSLIVGVFAAFLIEHRR
jgi:hypothetical protein